MSSGEKQRAEEWQLLLTILNNASEQVEKWPEWLRSYDTREGLKQIEKKTTKEL